MFLVNVRSMHALPRVIDAELMQSKLNVDFIKFTNDLFCINPLNPELNPICYLLALLGAHYFLHVSKDKG